jgi:WD40 repeat protein
VRVWDSTTGAAQATLQGHTNQVKSVAFSPDGKCIASGSDDMTVRLWDSTTGSAQATLRGHTDSVTSVAFSPDGKRVVSGSYDCTVRLWDSTTGAAQARLRTSAAHVTSVAFSPDGKRLVSGSYDRIVRLWDSTTGAAQAALKGHTGEVVSVSFSHHGTHVTSVDDRHNTRVWSLQTIIPGFQLPIHHDTLQTVPFPVFSIKDGWLYAQTSANGKLSRLCWVPDNRKPYEKSIAWNKSTVALGSKAGVVTILDCSQAVEQLIAEEGRTLGQ